VCGTGLVDCCVVAAATAVGGVYLVPLLQGEGLMGGEDFVAVDGNKTVTAVLSGTAGTIGNSRGS